MRQLKPNTTKKNVLLAINKKSIDQSFLFLFLQEGIPETKHMHKSNLVKPWTFVMCPHHTDQVNHQLSTMALGPKKLFAPKDSNVKFGWSLPPRPRPLPLEPTPRSYQSFTTLKQQ